MSQTRSGTAIGFTVFAAVMMIIVGVFHSIVGLAGILEDEFYLVTQTTSSNSTPRPGVGFTSSGASWFFSPASQCCRDPVWARTVGVILATLSAIVNFAFIPIYPVWSLVIIAIDAFVIWALTVHGRDIVG